MTSSNSTGGSPFPKWQIALAVGATGALGLGYWYLKHKDREPKKPSLNSTKDLSLSIDNPTQDDSEENPLKLAQHYKSEGNTLFKKGKYDEAIKFYNKAIEVCPENQKVDLATFYQNKAAAYEQLKKWSSVIESCNKALEYNMMYEKALYRRAKAYEVTKDWEHSLDDITAVCLLQSFGNKDTLFMADRVLRELGKQHAIQTIKNRKPILPSNHFIKTYYSSFSEDPVYKKLISTEEPIGEGEVKGFLKAKLAFATEDFDEIIPACTEEINSSESESPFIMEALSMRGSFYLLSAVHNKSLEDFNTIIDSTDCDYKIKVNALIKRASLYMQQDNIEQCLENFKLASKLGPNISDVYHHRGQVKLLMDKTEEARQDFSKAVELNPDFPIAVVQKYYADYRYAMLTQNMELHIKNSSDFRSAIERFPTCSEVFVLYGQVLAERNEFAEADKLYLKALEIDPKNATILVHRGLLKLNWKQNLEETVELIREAIKLDDKCSFALETLGTVEVQRGNLIVAIDIFDAAIDTARTETELVHLFSLKDAAISQLRVTSKLGIGPKLLNPSS